MADKEPNTVLDVQKVKRIKELPTDNEIVQVGYILQGRTIRPAAVGVSRKP